MLYEVITKFDLFSTKSGLKISDPVREQGVPRIENGVRHTFWRMSISVRGTTQLSDASWRFKTTSTLNRAKPEQSKEKQSG